MVIEWLKFRVVPELREKFIKLDKEIWTTSLADYPGFLAKEVWIEPTASDEVVFTIRWQSRQQWKSIPPEDLAAIETQFSAAMGSTNYQMLESKEYQIRKFAEHTS
ncbi:MAG: TIGR03792 family protein [Pleurocapsa sp.]